jgi:excisionase family DNA binding protein
MAAQPLLTIKDVVAFARQSDSTIRRAVRHGELPAYRMPGGLRFRQEDIAAGWTATPFSPSSRRARR